MEWKLISKVHFKIKSNESDCIEMSRNITVLKTVDRVVAEVRKEDPGTTWKAITLIHVIKQNKTCLERARIENSIIHVSYIYLEL